MGRFHFPGSDPAGKSLHKTVLVKMMTTMAVGGEIWQLFWPFSRPVFAPLPLQQWKMMSSMLCFDAE